MSKLNTVNLNIHRELLRSTMVDAFVYLGCMIDSSGGSRGEVLRRIQRPYIYFFIRSLVGLA